MRSLLGVLLSLVLAVSVPVISMPVHDTATAVSVHHKPKHDDNGKHKGHRKGKHNPHGNNPPPKHNPPKGGGKKPDNQPDRPRNNRPDPRNPRPRVDNPRGPERDRGRDRPTGQPRIKCVRIIKPVETRVETTIVYRDVPKTKTEKVFYGAGIFALSLLGAGLLALFIGFIVGWFRRKRNEEKFLDSLLNDK